MPFCLKQIGRCTAILALVALSWFTARGGQGFQPPSQTDPAIGDLRSRIRELETQLKQMQLILDRIAALFSQPEAPPAKNATATAEHTTPQIRLQSARSLFDQGVRAEGEHLCAIAIGHFTRAIQLDPTNDSAYLHRGNCFLELGENFLAIADLTESLRLQPQNTNAYLSRGHANYADAKYLEAVADFDEAIRRGANKAADYTGRAQAYLKINQPFKAVEDYTTALKLDPTPQNYVDRANAYEAARIDDKALQDCTQAIDLAPAFEAGYLCRAKVRLAIGNKQDAIQDLQSLLAINPNYTEAQKLLQSAQGTAVAQATEPPKPAVPPGPVPRQTVIAAGPPVAGPPSLSRVTLPSPKVVEPVRSPAPVSAESVRMATAKIFEARKLVNAGQAAAAIPIFDAVRESVPNLPLLYNSRGYAYFKLKDYAHAILDFSTAINLDGPYPNAVLNRAMAKRLSGDLAGYKQDMDLLKTLRR